MGKRLPMEEMATAIINANELLHSRPKGELIFVRRDKLHAAWRASPDNQGRWFARLGSPKVRKNPSGFFCANFQAPTGCRRQPFENSMPGLRSTAKGDFAPFGDVDRVRVGGGGEAWSREGHRGNSSDVTQSPQLHQDKVRSPRPARSRRRISSCATRRRPGP